MAKGTDPAHFGVEAVQATDDVAAVRASSVKAFEAVVHRVRSAVGLGCKQTDRSV